MRSEVSSPFVAFGVNPALELVECDLAYDRVDHVFGLLRQHRLALAFVAGLFQQRAESQHFAEHRSGFGQGQRGRSHQRALVASKHLMHAVTKFVREGHHIARLAHVVEQHIGMHGGNGRMGESAGRFAGRGSVHRSSSGQRTAWRYRPFPGRSRDRRKARFRALPSMK